MTFRCVDIRFLLYQMLPEERVADVAGDVSAEMEGRREVLSQRRSHSEVGFVLSATSMID